MIDKDQRSYAEAIAQGRCPVADPSLIHPKASVYGRLASILSTTDLQELRYESDSIQTDTISGVTGELSDRLAKLIGRSLADNATLVKDTNFHLLARASARDNKRIMVNSSAERLGAGIETAMVTEEITLRTVQSRIEQHGATITPTGLVASQRVPFKLAMLHLSEINSGIYVPGRLFNSDDGLILHPEHISMSSDKGLAIKGMDPIRGKAGFPDEPNIGCPATLIEGFIRDIHTITAETAMRCGVVTVRAA